MLVKRSSLTRHPSLSSIALGSYSRQRPVSLHLYMYAEVFTTKDL